MTFVHFFDHLLGILVLVSVTVPPVSSHLPVNWECALFGFGCPNFPPGNNGPVSACPSAETLPELISCLKDTDHMPRGSSNGFVPPSTSDRNAWKNAVTEMLNDSEDNKCDVTLEGSLPDIYEVVEFTDEETLETFCILVEKTLEGEADKKAWGTFITRLLPSRELHIEVPHPLYDIDTAEQGIAIFRSLEARSFLLSGAHRNANSDASTCDSRYKESDASHEDKHMFMPTVEAINSWYGSNEFVVVQMHGFSDLVCLADDVFLTYGGAFVPSSGDRILVLEKKLEEQWSANVPTGSVLDCAYTGGSNVQGRFLNGLSLNQVCSTAAQSYTGHFIHIEQKRKCRYRSEDAFWIQAMKSLWCTDVADCDSGSTMCNVNTGLCT